MTSPFVISDAHASGTTDATAATAQADNNAVTAAGTADQQGEPYQLSAEKMMMDNLTILGMLFFIFYFILIRPQQKRVRLHQEMMKGLQKGNKIITSGGLIGTIHKFEGDDVIVLEIAQDLRVRVSRGSVSEIVTDKPASANDN